MRLVFKRSVLVKVYRSGHRIIENNFYLTNRTLRHTNPTMVATLQKLVAHIQKPENSPHVFTKGRTSKHKVTDAVDEGFMQIHESTDLCTIKDKWRHWSSLVNELCDMNLTLTICLRCLVFLVCSTCGPLSNSYQIMACSTGICSAYLNSE